MADENQAEAAEGTSQPANAREGKLKFLIFFNTLIAVVGILCASLAFTELVVVPKVSVWLIERQIDNLQSGDVVEEEDEIPPVGTIYVIEDLVVNPAGSAGMRYVCTSVGLESIDPAVMLEVEARDAQIKDRLIRIFGSKTVPELVDVQSRETIREEIKLSIEELLPAEGLDAVYFVNFVLQ